MPETTHPRIVTVKELADILGVRPARIYRWSSEGRIPKLKIANCLRFDVDEVLAWASTASTGPGPGPEPAGDVDISDTIAKVRARLELAALR